MAEGDSPRVSVVVLAHGPEPLLAECVEAALRSTGVAADVVLVDNGCTTSAVDELDGRSGITVLRPGENTGFSGGCNLGARQARGEIVALVNGDAVVAPGALRALADALRDPGVGIASASLRLHDRPDLMNSAGNPVHYLGISWAGGLGDPASAHATARDITSATGAAVALRREVWDELDGFWDEMFAYCEDTELSLRCWQRGLRVRYVPDAVVTHRYEFSRNPLKLYLLERNRLLLLLTLYERRTLVVLAPAMVGLELVVLLVALRQGWARDKIRGWGWILRHRSAVRARRRTVQAARTVSDRALLAQLLTADFTPGDEVGFHAPAPVVAGSRLYWRLAQRLLS